MSFSGSFINLVGYGTILYLLLTHLPSLARNLILSFYRAWQEVERVQENIKEPIPF